MHADTTGDMRARISELEALVERQMGMLNRYDEMMSEMSRRPQSASRDGPGPRTEGAIDRALALLDQAIAKAERLTTDNRSLQDQLDRTVGLLEASIRNQEAMAAGRGAATTASTPARQEARDALEDTLSKYDRMLERSLSALEDAYRATEHSKKEIGERDKLLTRTLDLLQAAVENEPGQRRQSVIGRLFA